MLNQVWEGRDGRYISTDSIRRCWRKLDILPVTWNQDINNEVRRASIPEKHRVVSKEVCNKLFQLMASIKFKENECSIDTSTFSGNIFEDSFVTDGDFSCKDM